MTEETREGRGEALPVEGRTRGEAIVFCEPPPPQF